MMSGRSILRVAAAVTWTIVGGGLSGCQPLAAAPLPTPQAIHVQMSTSLRPWADELHACAGQLSGAGLVLDEAPASTLDPLQADLSLRLGGSPGENQFAAAIGEEALEVIVHPSNPVGKVSLPDLQGIFTGRIRTWEGIQGSPASLAGQPIQAWSYPAGDDLREAFDLAVLGGEGLAASTYLAPSPKAALEAIAENPASIGFVPRRWTSPSIRVVAVDAEEALLRQPVLALAAKEPQGQARQLLVCLQKTR